MKRGRWSPQNRTSGKQGAHGAIAAWIQVSQRWPHLGESQAAQQKNRPDAGFFCWVDLLGLCRIAGGPSKKQALTYACSRESAADTLHVVNHHLAEAGT